MQWYDYKVKILFTLVALKPLVITEVLKNNYVNYAKSLIYFFYTKVDSEVYKYWRSSA